MLIRFSAQNLFSFKEQIEFNTLPGNSKRLPHHKYKLANGKEAMRFSAIYGANGSGKSNLVKAIALLRDLVFDGKIPFQFRDAPFKLSAEYISLPIELAIEIAIEGRFYYYEVAVNKQRIQHEYFAEIGKSGEDKMLFERSEAELRFNEKWQAMPEFASQAQLIREDLMKPEEPLISLLSTFSNPMYEAHRQFRRWLDEKLGILFPDTKPSPDAFIRALKEDKGFIEFANQLVPTLSTGITALQVAEEDAEKVFSEVKDKELEEQIARVRADPNLFVNIPHPGTSETHSVLTNEDGIVRAQQLQAIHKGSEEKPVPFILKEESDGTRRMIEYLPMIYSLLQEETTFVVDELERSIHPLLIKEWLEKISKEQEVKGQLIFTTHESNLLNKDILRPDEIWFAEKNNEGATTFYPLSDFKEHHTLDIRKGYLNGRYGAIPFLGDFEALNWHEPSTHEAE